MLEIKKNNHSININFITFDFKTYQFIQNNHLLYKIIKEVGTLKCLGRKNNSIYFKKQSISKYHYKRLNIILHFIVSFTIYLQLLLDLLIVMVQVIYRVDLEVLFLISL